jgi:BirA family transcriptional regulator, biotin operon repressor / biotin---[acetyl-CoA-carboxylase] ligase
MPKLGSTLYRYHSVTSTNDLAREMAASGVSEGVAVLAFEQTAGRGRQGRFWSSPAGDGLYISIIIRPRIKAAISPLISLAAAVAVAEALIEEPGISADIKWPNDLMVGGRKLCGILVESAIEGECLQYAVMGIGVNIGQREFSPDLRQPATSLFLEIGRNVPLDDIVGPLLDRADFWYRATVNEPELVLNRWEQLSSYAQGREVVITSSDESFEGTTRGLTSAGALVVEVDDGRRREVMAGEVSLRTRAGLRDSDSAIPGAGIAGRS